MPWEAKSDLLNFVVWDPQFWDSGTSWARSGVVVPSKCMCHSCLNNALNSRIWWPFVASQTCGKNSAYRMLAAKQYSVQNGCLQESWSFPRWVQGMFCESIQLPLDQISNIRMRYSLSYLTPLSSLATYNLSECPPTQFSSYVLFLWS